MESISKRVRLIISVTFHDVCPVRLRRRMDLHICNFSPHLSLASLLLILNLLNFQFDLFYFFISLLKLINTSYDQFRGDFKRDF